MPLVISVSDEKQIIEAKVHKIPRHTYNIIRSFIESSDKPKYVWNVGIKLENSITFTKPGKWRLVVFLPSPQDNQEEKIYSVIELLTETGKTSFVIWSNGELEVGDIKVKTDDDLSLLSTFITSDVPFAYPISFYAIVRKVQSFAQIS